MAKDNGAIAPPIAQPIAGGEDVAPISELPCTFASLALPRWMCLALETPERDGGLGLVRPTPVQQVALPRARALRHVVVQAKAGTGKTVAFACVAVEKCLSSREGAGGGWSVVIAPTRELASQHARIIRRVAAWAPRTPALDGSESASDAAGDSSDASAAVQVVCAIGGAGAATRENARIGASLRAGRDVGVLVATPGRLHAILVAGGTAAPCASPSLPRVRCVVLDEADRLLGGTLDGQLGPLMHAIPPRTSVLAFSATFNPALRDRVQRLTGRARFLCVRAPAPREGEEREGEVLGTAAPAAAEDVVTLRRLRHYVMEAGPAGGPGRGLALRAKVAAAVRLLSSALLPFDQAVLFCNAPGVGEAAVEALGRAGIEAAWTCGRMPQLRREAALRRVREGSARVLVCSDLMARGIDLPRCSLVLSADLPHQASTLVHRAGRAGRYGREGRCVFLVIDHGEREALRAMLDNAGAHALALETLPLRGGEGTRADGDGLGEGKGGGGAVDARAEDAQPLLPDARAGGMGSGRPGC